MKLVFLISGLALLFLISQNSKNHNPETIKSLTTNVCFEQRSFDLLHELENIESNLIISFKQFSKNDKKRSTDSIDTLNGYDHNHSQTKYFNNSGKGFFFHELFALKKAQSVLQVFLL
jgi:hypothetical protein